MSTIHTNGQSVSTPSGPSGTDRPAAEATTLRVMGLPSGVIHTPENNDIDVGAGVQHVTSEPDCSDGGCQRTLLPLVRMGGRLYVVENCLHFFPQ